MDILKPDFMSILDAKSYPSKLLSIATEYRSQQKRTAEDEREGKGKATKKYYKQVKK